MRACGFHLFSSCSACGEVVKLFCCAVLLVVDEFWVRQLVKHHDQQVGQRCRPYSCMSHHTTYCWRYGCLNAAPVQSPGACFLQYHTTQPTDTRVATSILHPPRPPLPDHQQGGCEGGKQGGAGVGDQGRHRGHHQGLSHPRRHHHLSVLSFLWSLLVGPVVTLPMGLSLFRGLFSDVEQMRFDGRLGGVWLGGGWCRGAGASGCKVKCCLLPGCCCMGSG